MNVVLVEPFAHYGSHFPEEAKALGKALHRIGATVTLVSSYPMVGVEPGIRQESLFERYDDSSVAARRSLLSRLRKSRPYVTIHVGFLSLRCLARACSISNSGDVIVLVSGYLYPIALIGMFCSGRVLLYILRDFSRVTRSRKSAIADWLKKLFLWVADKRNVVHFTSIVDPAAAEETLNLGRSFTYIPAVGIREDVATIDRHEARRKLELPLDSTIFLVFGVGHAGKDYPTIIEASKMVQSDALIVFAGATSQGHADNNVERLLAGYDMEDRVILRNEFIPENEVPLYFSAADALLLSYKDGFVVGSGIVRSGVEYALPMIGSDGGSIGYTLRRWSLGFPFRGGDPKSLSAAVNEFITLDERARDTFAEGRANYAADYSWPRVAKAHIALYKRLRQELR